MASVYLAVHLQKADGELERGEPGLTLLHAEARLESVVDTDAAEEGAALAVRVLFAHGAGR